MINLLSQNTDTISKYDFSTFEYLSTNSNKMLFDIDTISQETIFYGMEGLERPFMQQFGSVLFLVFAVLFIVSSLFYRRNNQSLVGSIKFISTVGGRKKSSYSEQMTALEMWGNLFYVFQAFVLFTVLFTDIVISYTNHYYSIYDYLILFLQIFGVIFLFVFSKYLFYRFVRVVLLNSKTNDLVNVYFQIINVVGTLSFIPIVAYFYIPELKELVLFFLSAVFILSRITVFIKSYVFFRKAHIGGLYFFVYLCAVEIMPYFLLYKAIVLID